jgi:hypothetical protein
MSDSGKLGVVAVILWVGGTVLALRAPEPAGIVLTIMSFALACLAAWKGSRWWLTVPFAMVVEMCFGLTAAFGAL